jgi:hypothetical protein
MRRVFLLAGLLLALSTTGCPPPEPAVVPWGVRLGGASPYGIDLIMLVKVRNDNSFDVKVRNVRAQVTLGPGFQLPIVFSPEVWLPSDQSSIVAVPVTIPWAMVGPLLAATAGSHQIGYRVVGSLDVSATRALEIESDDYRINATGALSRGDLVAIAGRGVLGGPTTPMQVGGVGRLEHQKVGAR